MALSPRSPTIETYDPAGCLQTLTAPGGTALNYTYDGALPLNETLTGAVNGSLTRTYDNDGLLTQAGSLTLSHNAQDEDGFSDNKKPEL